MRKMRLPFIDSDLLYKGALSGKCDCIISSVNGRFSGEDDRGKTSPRALVFTCCDIQSERL